MTQKFLVRRPQRLAAIACAASMSLAGLVFTSAPAPAAISPAQSAERGDLEQRAHDAGLAAYIIGYPLVTVRRTMAIRTCRNGINTLTHRARLATPADRDVVTPNNDTVYSSAFLDLRPGPQIFSLPAADPERYFSFQFLDMYTGVFEEAHGTPDGRSKFAVVGPDWRGKTPEGMRVVTSPTNDVWVIGRTFVNGPEDLAAAAAFQQNYALSGPPGTPVVPPGTDCATLPTPQSVPTAGAAFFDELEAALQAAPPTKHERKQLKPLYKLGDGARDLPGADSDPAVVAGLTSAVTEGQAQIEARADTPDLAANGWTWSLGIGVWGTDYLRRAAVTSNALGALTSNEALYYFSEKDASGAPLTGASAYRLHFPAGELPPYREGGFWSLTMYDAASRFLVDNPINRYAINNATPGVVRNEDGSLDLYVQQDAPAGHESNWLPAPEGEFYLVLRVYLPASEALDSTWVPNALVGG